MKREKLERHLRRWIVESAPEPAWMGAALQRPKVLRRAFNRWLWHERAYTRAHARARTHEIAEIARQIWAESYASH